jgi:hypothetical protein
MQVREREREIEEEEEEGKMKRKGDLRKRAIASIHPAVICGIDAPNLFPNAVMQPFKVHLSSCCVACTLYTPTHSTHARTYKHTHTHTQPFSGSYTG